MDRVEPVGVHVVGKPTRTSDSGHEDEILSWEPQFGHDPLNVGEDWRSAIENTVTKMDPKTGRPVKTV